MCYFVFACIKEIDTSLEYHAIAHFDSHNQGLYYRDTMDRSGHSEHGATLHHSYTHVIHFCDAWR